MASGWFDNLRRLLGWYSSGVPRSYRVAKSQSFAPGPVAYQAIVHTAASQPVQAGSVASEAIA